MTNLSSWLLHPRAKPVLWALCAVPMLTLMVAAASDLLGANPAEKLVQETGEWALRFLWATLAISPLRTWFKLPALLRFRRALGVSTFVYALIHFLAYAWLDKGWVWADILKDIAKRNFILVGVAALVLMTPLAATSFNGAIRAIGGHAWKWLHRLVYVVALLALLHFFWKKAGKHDFNEVSIYGAILAALLGWRFGLWARNVH
ncbi:sulfite oxidase heme-binding subunit YedZ [Aquabacterium sp.]|uniref:sulfite oxidase heme-binding subunit YedZ n=1 Tax=Aquabacterium sp. TaxID=1872578 RepID=UPI0035AF1410